MKLTDSESKKVQILRGLAILAVVFIHNTPMGLTQVFIRPFLNFSVGLFLFFSGMLSNAEKWNPLKRICKVIVPYCIWTFIYSVGKNIGTPTSILSSFLTSLIMANAAGMLYYVFVYCEFTLLIPLIDKLAKSKMKYWGFAIAPLEIIVMRFLPIILGQEIHEAVEAVMSVSCLGWFSYFYLGYLIGNKHISVVSSQKKIAVLWAVSVLLQYIEGYLYYLFGDSNCGTQLKLTAILSGVLFALLAYNYITNDCEGRSQVFKLLGDNAFGIYFSHMAVMGVLNFIPGYLQYAVYPLNAIISLSLSVIFVLLGKKILGNFSKYLAL